MGTSVTPHSTQQFRITAAVVGAGVVGLAIARQLSLLGLETALIERESDFGTGISSRNSEVIHSGLYYKKNSLKARLCVEGNRQLYEYCARSGVKHQRLGKLIVATNESELAILQKYMQNGLENGVLDLSLLDAHAVRQLEPELNAVGAVLCPSTGIIDTHGLMSVLLQDFEQAGGIYVRNTPVISAAIESDHFRLSIGGRDPCDIEAKYVVNAAGFGAQPLAQAMHGFAKAKIPSLHYAIGHYYTLSGRSPFQRLIYPVAGAGGLGVHLTLDLQGCARFGPDISWRESEDYTFDDTRAEEFTKAIQNYWPGLDGNRLSPGYTGIRPKLWGPSNPDQDFLIMGQAEHGIAGLVHLFGIESPGLTSSMAIAAYVAALLRIQ
jgi:L-2-hydroxyglutarate oxidase LhgO